MSRTSCASTESVVTGNHIVVDTERCKGCYLCVVACPHNLIVKSDSLNNAGCYPVRPVKSADERCTACGMCWQVCPDVAIAVYKKEKERRP